MDYYIIIYIVLGILPSSIWLFYYLKEDVHPEPKRMILKIFLWGALITLPVLLIQIGLTNLLDKAGINLILKNLVYWFLIIAFSEEFFKYLVIRLKVIDSPDLDEPLDVMLYMVIAALGFAAVENIFYLFMPIGQMSFDQLISKILIIDIIRFVGATFLHTLCSAAVGYSLAISFCEVKARKISLIAGIVMATALHGFYDLSIITLPEPAKFIVPIVIILTLAFFVFSGFEKLKKMKSICKIN